MPQMAPISWLILFIIFSMTFLLFSMMNYFSSIPHPKTLSTLKINSHQSLNWKW